MTALQPLFNICDPVFKTVVTCNTISSEGYEVTNLLSDNLQKRKSGFLCDRFIKPPVEIVFKFPFDMCLKYIQVGAEIGQQKSSGIEISATSVPYNSSGCSGASSFRNRSKFGLGNSSNTERVVSFVLQDQEKGAIIFCPLHYGRHMPNPVSSPKVDFVQKPMLSQNRSVIAHATSLTVRIFRTSGSSVPAISSIEIWGGPSSCVPPSKILEISSLWESALENQHSDELHGLQGDTCHSTAPPAPRNVAVSLPADIPEEFLDVITCDIMALPMVLPSGKVVDQQTLDLHAKAEAKWGRPPSDPFTGILFRDGYRPVLDSSLKARIDRFLVLNQDRKDLKTVPRTVGRKRPLVTHQNVSQLYDSQLRSSIVNTSRKWSLLSSSAVHNEDPITKDLGNDNSSNSLKTKGESSNLAGSGGYPMYSKVEQEKLASSSIAKKIKLDEVAFVRSKGKECSVEDDDVVFLDEEPSNSMFNEKKKLREIIKNVKNHEKIMNDSLDLALQATLSGLPSFINKPAQKVSVDECSSCKICKALYSLPCKHFLCRPCLVNVTKQTPSVCQTCGAAFKSCDPVFYHK